jgi:hypothetical protein
MALGLTGCAQGSLFGAPSFPELDTMPGSVVYRDLATIPERPPKPETRAQDEARQTLDAERATTAEAANRLRTAPFDMPDPAPPPVEIAP